MSLTGALSSALSGLRANQDQMRVVSNNVSNAGVEGFTRKSAPQSTRIVGLSTNGGVTTGEVQREVDEFLVGRLREGTTDLSFTETKSEFFQRVQDFFGTLQNDTNLSNTINDFRTSLENLAIEPENSAAQASVVQQAQQLTQQFRDFSQQTQDLRGEADLQIDVAVDKINENLKEVRDLNVQIAQAKGNGRSTADLEDQRDRALTELSEQIDINTFERSSGEVVVVTNDAAARPLIDGFVEQLNFGATGSLGSGEAGGPVTFADGQAVDPDRIGGRLGALLQVRNQDLPNFQADLDRLAAQLREQVNEAHNTGVLGNRQIDSGGTLTGTHQFSPSAQAIQGASGTLEIVALDNNGRVATAGNGSAKVVQIDLSTLTIDGNLGDGDPSAGNGLLDRINTAISNQLDVLDDGNGGNNSAAVANTEGFQLGGDGQPVSLTNPFGDGSNFVIRTNDARIESNQINAGDTNGSGTPDRNFSHFFGFNDFFETPDLQNGGDPTNPDIVTGDMALPGGANASAPTGNGVSAASEIRVRQDIVADPSRMSRIEPQTARGDTALPNGEPTVSQRMAQVFDEVFQFRAPSELRTTTTQRAQTGVGDPNAALTAAPPAGLGIAPPANPVLSVNGNNVNVPDPANASLNDIAAAIQGTSDANARVVEDNGSHFLEVRAQNGGSVTIADAPGNNVISSLNLQQQTIQGDQTTGNIGSRTVTLANFAGDLLQFQANETARLNDSTEAKQGVQNQLQLRVDNTSGVNIDQELANLTEFQQAFNANARVISTVNEMFDTLSQMAR